MMSKKNVDEDDDQLFGPSLTALKHYAKAVVYEDYRNQFTNENDDITMISLWTEDQKGHLFSGKPITAKNVIKRPINEDSGDFKTNNVIE